MSTRRDGSFEIHNKNVSLFRSYFIVIDNDFIIKLFLKLYIIII